jgi:hypothetical protein
VATTKKTTANVSHTSKTSRPKPAGSAKGSSKKPAGKVRTSSNGASGKNGQKHSVTIDRRSGTDRRVANDRRQKNEPVAVERRSIERRKKVSRRRQIDPTTCERDYTPAEVEFMNALDDYKRTSGRMFPTCSEVLEVLRGLGYSKRTDEELPDDATPEEALAGTAE